MHIEDEIYIGGNKIKVFHTPGHTPGHITLYAEKDGFIFPETISSHEVFLFPFFSSQRKKKGSEIYQTGSKISKSLKNLIYRAFSPDTLNLSQM